MPLAHRLTDLCTGHGCWPPRPTCSGSPDTVTNNLLQTRVTDCYVPHCCPPCHPGVLVACSPTVITNNLQTCRQGDVVDCGSNADTHSPDVDIGP